MPKIKEDWSTRTIKTPDGITITFFDNKLHNWNGPALKYPSSYKQKAEYYLYLGSSYGLKARVALAKKDWLNVILFGYLWLQNIK